MTSPVEPTGVEPVASEAAADTGAPSRASQRSAIRWLIALVVMLLLLLLGAWGYWRLASPAELTSEVEQGTEEGDHLFSIYGFEGDLLRRPSSVGVDDDGNIHVADTGKRRIVVFDEGGQYVTTYGEAGQEELQIWEPIDVAVAPDGRSFVLDKGKKKIVIFDVTRTANGVLTFEDFPLSITIENDALFVTTEKGVLIGDLADQPNLLTGYVQWGKEPGQFDKPSGVAVGQDDTLYVADSFNYRVQAIGSDGSPLWQYGEPIPPGEAIQFSQPTRLFGLPASIAVDDNGYLYVVDGTNSEIVVLTPEGEFQETIGGVGHDDGMFYYPDGIDYHDGTIVVADKYNDRVQVFRTPTVGAAAQVGRFAPFAIPLLLLLPLLLFLLRRKPKHVIAHDFLQTLHQDPDGPEVSKTLKQVFATAQVVEIGEGYDELELQWKSVDVSDEQLERIQEEYDLDPATTQGLAAAASVRGKRVLLTDEERLREVAAELDIPSLTYEEIKAEVIREDDGEKTADAQEGGE